MDATISNVKVKYIRPKYKNLQEWMADSKNVYIGRARIVFINNKRFPENDSPFCNPYKISKNKSREEVIQEFEKYIIDKILADEGFRYQLLELRGKNLGCWCHPEPCHGHILLKIINKIDT